MVDGNDRRRTLVVRAGLALALFVMVHAITNDYWPALALAGIALGAPPWARRTAT